MDDSDIPPLLEPCFEKASLRISASQVQQLVQIEPDVLQWFQAPGGEYRALITSMLRDHLEKGE